MVYGDVIGLMREALLAQSRGECDTPMPMHLEIAPVEGEVHMKASYRRGGRYFALKTATSFPRQTPSGNGMMLLFSAETGVPAALLADAGHLTDVRTAAVSAMMARELKRTDTVLGILGTGIQARLQAQMHAAVLDIHTIWIWGRNPEHAEDCRRDLEGLLPGAEVCIARTPAEVAQHARLIVTCTASRSPLLDEVQPGTHVSAVGADSPGKQELALDILRRADLLLVDSLRQCEKLGELQHAPDQCARAVEMGMFLEQATSCPTSVGDFTGLGVEDLLIAEYCYENRKV